MPTNAPMFNCINLWPDMIQCNPAIFNRQQKDNSSVPMCPAKPSLVKSCVATLAASFSIHAFKSATFFLPVENFVHDILWCVFTPLGKFNQWSHLRSSCQNPNQEPQFSPSPGIPWNKHCQEHNQVYHENKPPSFAPRPFSNPAKLASTPHRNTCIPRRHLAQIVGGSAWQIRKHR